MGVFSSGEERFTLQDLTVVHGPPDAIFDKCVNLAEHLVPNTSALVLFRDVEARRAVVRSFGARAKVQNQKSKHILPGSLTDQVCRQDTILSSLPGNEANWSPAMPELEASRAKGFIAAPIHDPAEHAVGMLICLSLQDANWTEPDLVNVANLADLITQRIMLKAALKTVELMSREQFGITNITPVRRH